MIHTAFLVAAIGNVLLTAAVGFVSFKAGYHKAMARCCGDVARELQALSRAHGDTSGEAYAKVPALLDRLAASWGTKKTR